MNLGFLPTLPLHLSYPLLFGVLLVAGMMGGELARLLKMPRLVGYVVVGLIIGPLSKTAGMGPLIDEARIFVDLALGLVLFELGRRMDLTWMKRDWTLAAMGIAESAFSFIAVFLTLMAFNFTPVKAGLAAGIAMTTAPSVLLFMSHETRSEGQVTERAINLAALNGLLASIIVTIMLGSAHFASARVDLDTAVLHPLYLFVGSLLLGAFMAAFTRVIARSVERSSDMHFTLIAGMVVAAVGLATLLKLPVILALLAFGLFARNDERGHDLLNVSLAPVGRLLYIVLFVITGASLPLGALATAGWIALALAVARTAGKFLGVVMFAQLGGLRLKQGIGLGLALTPMSTLALLMQHDIGHLFPGFAHDLGAVFVGAILITELASPFAVQYGLRLAGETLPDTTGQFRAFRPNPSAKA
ncbi:MAG TPA: cation:proton antiporter [Usitatibacter sp.]|nr:cation:proton antiporter [Usitatibacter sp.]